MQQGFYPDPPSRRFAFDEDGTRAFRLTPANDLVELGSATKMRLNAEDFGVGSASGLTWSQQNAYGYLVFIFPEVRTVTHMYCNQNPNRDYNGGKTGTVQYSTDTTNGLDGNWTTSGTLPSPAQHAKPSFRTNLNQIIMHDIKAVRVYFGYVGAPSSNEIGNCHIWGYKSAGQTLDRVDFCDIDGSELSRDFDYGDQPRNTTKTWSPTNGFNQGTGLYLRNRSIDKVAIDVMVNAEDLSNNMADFVGISKDNTSFGMQIAYGQIQPQQIVGPIYIAHTTLPNSAMGMFASRLQLQVGTWL